MRVALAVVFSLAAVCVLGLVAFTLVTSREPTRGRLAEVGAAPAKMGTKVTDNGPIDDGGFAVAAEFTAPIHDSTSLSELREAVDVRGRLGLAVLKAESDGLKLGFRPPREEIARVVLLRHQIGLLNLYEGQFAEAAVWFRKAQELGRPPNASARDRAQRDALLGLVALRLGEIGDRRTAAGSGDPTSATARRDDQSHSDATRGAVEQFRAFLAEWPDDLRVRWLLNVAYMELGQYPAGVPAKYLIELNRFRSKLEFPPFEDVAQRAGLNSAGPSLAGGSVFDDFDGDGLPDLFITSLDTRRGATLFVNRGDGTLTDRSAAAGIDDQVYALNVTHADFDNDGDLDLLLLRGGRDRPLRLSLLRNRGTGAFDDVTVASGLGEPIASRSAAWGDYDNDGWVDVFVCSEGEPDQDARARSRPSPRNRCRLYRNRRDGTFEDLADQAGVGNEHIATGAAWGDYDDDGRLDLYVSNFDAPCRLYRNLGDRTFREEAMQAGVAGPTHVKATACWFWDFDNDGRLDLFVNDSHAGLADVAASYLGRTVDDAGHPRVYRNMGPRGFRDVSRELGLDRPVLALGANFGDIDNDGYLDIFLAAGWRSLASPFPSLLLKNIEGRRFDDVTESHRTSRIQKGSGVSFADWDSDGDLDFFVNPGGTVPADTSFPLLFKNPGHGRHWLKVKLVGTKTNRGALGARIKVDVGSADGRPRSIDRRVGNNSSFGGNSLVETVGLSEATEVAKLTVFWPTSHTRQEFAHIAADQEIEITESAASFKVRRPARPTSPSP
jgi:hypothetical protein